MNDPHTPNFSGTSISAHNSRCPTPFNTFPFTPFGLGLFDTDPSRILSILHHQSLLAEEALRYRGLFLSPKDTIRFNPIAEMFSKEQEMFLKRAALFKNNLRYPSDIFASSTSLPSSTAASINNNKDLSATIATAAVTATASKDLDILPINKRIFPSAPKEPTPMSRYHHQHSSSSDTASDEVIIQATNDSILKEGLQKFSNDYLANDSPTTGSGPSSSNTTKDVLDEILHKRSGSYFKDGLRFNPMTVSEKQQQQQQTSGRDKTSSASSSTSSSPIIKPIPETLLLQDGTTIEEETKCTVCMAIFPSVWLLEQHAALQHAGIGAMGDEKPFICEQCGQSYRYRSAYVKHREQNHRARLPADKLFTCDVCGMQFRYLKSFKKHRLNHALERLHGKNEKKNAGESGSELVTSSNDDDGNPDLKITIKEEEEDDEQDDTIDSAGAVVGSSEQHHHQQQQQQNHDDGLPKITSSAEMVEFSSPVLLDQEGFHQMAKRNHQQHHHLESAMPTTSINSLLTAERIPSDQALGLNPQEASILNFLRVDAAERQRDRRFACPFCGKCVRSKENLKLHVRKHTGERPFVCLFCGRAFGGKSDLTRHLRIHTGERPYHCEACGKCFARADYLSKHLTTHIHNSPR